MVPATSWYEWRSATSTKGTAQAALLDNLLVTTTKKFRSCTQTEWGWESINRNISLFLNECRILQAAFPPHQQQSNALIDQTNRKLRAAIRCNIVHASLLLKYWEYIVLDVFQKYSTLLHTLTGKILYNKWQNSPIPSHQLLLFGAHGHLHVHGSIKSRSSHSFKVVQLLLYMTHGQLILEFYCIKAYHVHEKEFHLNRPALDLSVQHRFSKDISERLALRSDGINQTRKPHPSSSSPSFILSSTPAPQIIDPPSPTLMQSNERRT